MFPGHLWPTCCEMTWARMGFWLIPMALWYYFYWCDWLNCVGPWAFLHSLWECHLLQYVNCLSFCLLPFILRLQIPESVVLLFPVPALMLLSVVLFPVSDVLLLPHRHSVAPTASHSAAPNRSPSTASWAKHAAAFSYCWSCCCSLCRSLCCSFWQYFCCLQCLLRRRFLCRFFCTFAVDLRCRCC